MRQSILLLHNVIFTEVERKRVRCELQPPRSIRGAEAAPDPAGSHGSSEPGVATQLRPLGQPPLFQGAGNRGSVASVGLDPARAAAGLGFPSRTAFAADPDPGADPREPQPMRFGEDARDTNSEATAFFSSGRVVSSQQAGAFAPTQAPRPPPEEEVMPAIPLPPRMAPPRSLGDAVRERN